MKTCKGVESIDYAIDKDVDFLAYIVSPWHLLGVKAVLRKLRTNAPNISGIIMICKNHCNKFLITEIPEFEGIEFAYYESDKWTISHIVVFLRELIRRKDIHEKKRYLIIPYKIDAFLYALYSWKNKGECITECYVIDEGLGSYLGIGIDNRVLNIKELLSIAKNKLVELLRLIFELKLKKHALIFNFSLLMWDENNRLSTNQKVVDYYRQAISREMTTYQKDNGVYDNVVLINTQPLEGIEGNADIDILYDFCKQCYAKGIKVVIKPHPAERDLKKYNKFEQYVKWDLRNELSQEVILNSLDRKPLAIVSFCSTTLITSTLFWGIPSFSFAKMLSAEDISLFLRNKLTDFMSVFDEYTFFCDSVESLVNILVKEMGGFEKDS